MTHMGFGLNVTPSIMQAIMDAVLLKDETIQQAKSIHTTASVKQHLVNCGLVSKEPERLKDGMRMLGLQVWGECNTL